MAKQFCVKTLILSLCVFFVCTAFAGQKDGRYDIYRLRCRPKRLSEADVKELIKKHNFFTGKYGLSWDNPAGSFKNGFADSGNTVTDSETGLMWEKSGSDSMKHNKAQSYIDDLKQRMFAGHDDWRLPTLEELASLLENREADRLYTYPAFDRKQQRCWTADRYTYLYGGAWMVGFRMGYMGWHNDSYSFSVRAVRSMTPGTSDCDEALRDAAAGIYENYEIRVSDPASKPEYRLRSEPGMLSPEDVRAMLRKYNFYDMDWNSSGGFTNSFTDNGNGTVSDSVTGLMWQKSGSDNYVKYDEAQTCIDALNSMKFAGYNDWRLPTLEELASLLESREMNGLNINPLFDRKKEWFWSSDTRISSGLAWDVNFYLGYVNQVSINNSYYVRAVRSWQ